MKTIKHLAAMVATSIALFTATPVVAVDNPGHEVLINMERFNELAPAEQQEVLALKSRLEEMIAMDRSTLTPAQRAELRTEWKELKREMRQHNGGGNVIYISTGALIIIILLLIIIF